jgi:hypothetical protein
MQGAECCVHDAKMRMHVFSVQKNIVQINILCW